MPFQYDRIHVDRDDDSPDLTYHRAGLCPQRGNRHSFNEVERSNLQLRRDGTASFVRVICGQCEVCIEMYVTTPAQVATFGSDAVILAEANRDPVLTGAASFTHQIAGGRLQRL